jgi:hypothetical protein
MFCVTQPTPRRIITSANVQPHSSYHVILARGLGVVHRFGLVFLG